MERSATATPIAVGLLLPQGLLRHATARLVGEWGPYHVVAHAADAPAFKRAFALAAPQVAVVGVELAVAEGGGLIPWLARHMPTTRVLLLGTAPDPAVGLHLLCAGAHGFCCQSQGPEVLQLALQHVSQGALHWPPTVEALLRTLHPPPLQTAPTTVALTTRQQRFVQLVVRNPGLHYPALAPMLGVQLCTVHKHREAVFAKTGCRSKGELLLWAVRNGIG